MHTVTVWLWSDFVVASSRSPRDNLRDRCFDRSFCRHRDSAVSTDDDGAYTPRAAELLQLASPDHNRLRAPTTKTQKHGLWRVRLTQSSHSAVALSTFSSQDTFLSQTRAPKDMGTGSSPSMFRVAFLLGRREREENCSASTAIWFHTQMKMDGCLVPLVRFRRIRTARTAGFGIAARVSRSRARRARASRSAALPPCCSASSTNNISLDVC